MHEAFDIKLTTNIFQIKTSFLHIKTEILRNGYNKFLFEENLP